MTWAIFVAGAVLAWGAYGALLFEGQMQLGNPLKALLCVGVAYFLIGVVVPVAGLSSQGAMSGFNTSGLITATIAGIAVWLQVVFLMWAHQPKRFQLMTLDWPDATAKIEGKERMVLDETPGMQAPPTIVAAASIKAAE